MIILSLNTYTFIITFLIASGLSFLVYRRKPRKIRFFLIPLMIFYTLLLIQVTILPIYILDKDELKSFHETVGDYITYYQITPFDTIKKTFISFPTVIKQDVGNIVLLMPIPIFVGFIKKYLSPIKIFLLGFFASLLIESAQLLISFITKFPMHFFDVDDLILNSLGVVLGILLFYLIKKTKPLYNIINKSP